MFAFNPVNIIQLNLGQTNLILILLHSYSLSA